MGEIKKKIHQRGHAKLSSETLFFYLSQIRQNAHKKKTGLVQHANHQDLEFKHEQAELSFPHQLSPQNDSEQNEK